MEERYRTVQSNPVMEEISKLTPEEKLAWERCLQTEGFFKGGLGGALVGGMMGFWCARITNMQKNVKILMICTSTVGFIYGKLLYAGICLNKAAPRIKENLQRIYSMRATQSQYMPQPVSPEPSTPTPPTDESTPSIYFDEPLTSYDTLPAFDDYSDTSTNIESETPVMQNKNTSYDELRKKHRDEYLQSVMQRPATRTPAAAPPVNYTPVRKPSTENYTKYGDVWD